jgi:Reverse transcriptase (RNA-dependent DNA polymerase)
MGTFEHTVILFGLCNTPAIFQRRIDSILQAINDQRVQWYLDDIIFSTESKNVCEKLIGKVMKHLTLEEMYAKRRKCNLVRQNMEFLGHIISAGGCCAQDEMRDSIAHWSVFTSIKELRRFLGRSIFTRRYIPRFQELTAGLTGLLKKNARTLAWSSAAQIAFMEI